MAKKRKLKKLPTFFFLICVILLIIYIVLFPTKLDKLVKLGYSKEEAKVIINKLNPDSINIILNNDYDSKIINIIENKDFNKKKFENYIYLIQNTSLKEEDIVFVANRDDYDKNIKYNDLIVSILKEKYYIKDNLNRYIEYSKKSNNSKNIVTYVNVNRDYDYYTNTKKTDTTKGKLLIVNKYYQLDKNYKPTLVVQNSKYGKSNIKQEKETYEAFIKMFNAAKDENLTLYVNSAYRSYEEQEKVFKDYENKMKDKATLYAAKPGYSEHQTGMALDIFKPGSTTKTFGNTKEAKWLSKNAYKYGFILRYPKGKENITGYEYESWHYRYVGVETAKKIFEENITYDEYYEYYLK